jgi:nucleoside-diphosphate-sugar epimerase
MATAPSTVGKPTSNWLILGGCGFIGRNLVKYLLDNALAGDVRVADKRHPAMSALSAEHKAALLDERVEFLMCDLALDEFVEQAFSASRSGAGWDYCVNLVAETGHGKKEEFYAKGVAAAEKCAAAAAGAGVKKFIQLSSAAVYRPEKHGGAGAEEAAPQAPWTEPAVHCARAEAAALRAAGAALPVVLLRPALVYGPGDTAGLMTRAVVASTFKADRKKMEFLWDASLKLSTVHVFDVARAIYFAARKAAHGAVYNLADKGDSDQGRVAAAISGALGVETSFKGSMVSSAAVMAMGLEKIVGVVNHNVMLDWMELRKKHGIENTPLSPFLHPSLLAQNNLHVSGAAIEGAWGAWQRTGPLAPPRPPPPPLWALARAARAPLSPAPPAILFPPLLLSSHAQASVSSTWCPSSLQRRCGSLLSSPSSRASSPPCSSRAKENRLFAQYRQPPAPPYPLYSSPPPPSPPPSSPSPPSPLPSLLNSLSGPSPSSSRLGSASSRTLTSHCTLLSPSAARGRSSRPARLTRSSAPSSTLPTGSRRPPRCSASAAPAAMALMRRTCREFTRDSHSAMLASTAPTLS